MNTIKLLAVLLCGLGCSSVAFSNQAGIVPARRTLSVQISAKKEGTLYV